MFPIRSKPLASGRIYKHQVCAYKYLFDIFLHYAPSEGSLADKIEARELQAVIDKRRLSK